jgi:hypothetical protein
MDIVACKIHLFCQSNIYPNGNNGQDSIIIRFMNARVLIYIQSQIIRCVIRCVQQSIASIRTSIHSLELDQLIYM